MICNTYVEFFSTLADPTRLTILKLLRTRPCSVSEIGEKLDLEQSRVSHNLKKLSALGFVAAQRKGKSKLYRIDEERISPLLDIIERHVNKYYAGYCKCKGDERLLRWKSANKLVEAHHD